ncbi:hypothetical protein O6H91_01G051200 [Diphasiastrum complanatum]|uniref:Uncharacterized protein n=1 Tax=Diphasiastrum complanatum TaxID=34168 RepID=A0ACC2EQN5_DIPCM|nr:hypothetical protein O6H91_01G051200 [Diphasiastrum complanatum]
MGPKGSIRTEAEKLPTKSLVGRLEFKEDKQSSLIHLLVTQRSVWKEKVYLENLFYLHGYWAILVEKYEHMMKNHDPGYGDDRWPFTTQFVGCKPSGGYGDYPVDRCIKHMERAFNFADTSTILQSSEVFWTESLTKHHTPVLTYKVNPLYSSLHGY